LLGLFGTKSMSTLVLYYRAPQSQTPAHRGTQIICCYA